MSRDRFDVLERFTPLFETPEPPFEGFLRRRDRKRRNQRIAAGVIGIAIFLATIWIIAAGGPFDRTFTPATTGPTGPTDPTGPPHPTGVGLLGLPPEGATPSSPERGKLVLGIGFGHTAGDPGRFSLHVYADGRLIWQWIGGPPPDVHASSTGLIEQRLTPEGVELVRAEVLSSGFFDHDRELVGALGDLHYGGIEVRDGDRLVHLAWGDVGFDKGTDPIATTPTPEQVGALERLDARLEDLASWLPASAWEDPELRAYVPSRYSVCYMGQNQPLARPRILDLLPASAEDLLRASDTTQSEVNGPRGFPFWCSVVTTQEARELAGILRDAGASRRSPELSYSYSSSVSSEEVVDIGLGPVLPHEA
jgi:hypothetical protein